MLDLSGLKKSGQWIDNVVAPLDLAAFLTISVGIWTQVEP